MSVCHVTDWSATRFLLIGQSVPTNQLIGQSALIGADWLVLADWLDTGRDLSHSHNVCTHDADF